LALLRIVKSRIPNEVDNEQVPEGRAVRHRPCRFRGSPGGCEVRTQHHNTQAPGYSNNTVVQDGYVLGADPDRGVRLELRRDGRYWQDN
jgi:hypothetical protein